MDAWLGSFVTQARHGRKVGLLLLLVVLPAGPIPACTIAVKADRDVILVGNNEDYLEPRMKLWFLPAREETRGRVLWGFDRALWPYQGGMNDQGLFVDINAVGPTGYQEDAGKPQLPGNEIDYFLSQCVTVDEAVQRFHAYNIDLGSVKFVFADAAGNSAIVEWLAGKLHIIRRAGDCQVSTNYTSPLDDTDPRNRVCQQILSSQPRPTIDLMRRALSASACSAPFCQTLYSTICDLKSRKLHVYYFHNFEECVTFHLDAELRKGEAAYPISSLFAIRPYSENLALSGGSSQLGAQALVEFIAAHGIEKGLARFHAMAAETRSYHRYVFEEWILRDVGMVLQSNGMTKEAAAIFALNTQQYPASWQAYYDLAESCARLGDAVAAQRNYRMALGRAPDAVHVADIQKKLDITMK